MDLKEIAKIVERIAEEKKIDKNYVLEAVETSLAAAYRKEYGHKGMVIRASLNLENGDLLFKQIKTVVEPEEVRIVEEDSPEIKKIDAEEEMPRYNPDRHIFLEEAKKIDAEAKSGDEIVFKLPSPDSDFGRIAAQTAKQNILQRLREVERDSIMAEFKDKEGTIISGTVRRFERGSVYVDTGRAEGVIFGSESIPGEHYRIGERLKFYVVSVQDDYRGANIILSRSHPKFIEKLFEQEVPEIADGTVEVKAISREAGSRTKIAVGSNDEGVDAVGSFVGHRGTRVMTVNNEVGQEKIDIIGWSEDPEVFIAHALSPVKVSRVEIEDKREAKVFVPEDQLSLAIGRGGQNVRLAVKLTGWKIDVRSEARPEEEIEGGVVTVKEDKEVRKEEEMSADESLNSESENIEEETKK